MELCTRPHDETMPGILTSVQGAHWISPHNSNAISRLNQTPFCINNTYVQQVSGYKKALGLQDVSVFTCLWVMLITMWNRPCFLPLVWEWTTTHNTWSLNFSTLGSSLIYALKKYYVTGLFERKTFTASAYTFTVSAYTFTVSAYHHNNKTKIYQIS